MALTDGEIAFCKRELGYNLLNVGAEPMISVYAVFEQVIQKFTTASVSSTSSTPVAAATSPTPQTLALGSAVGFNAGDIVVIDVDSRQERATIQSVSGSSITALLSFTHGPSSFPVVVEGPETMIRDVLRQLRLISIGMNGSPAQMTSILDRIGLKKVDDLEFFGGGNTLASQGVDPLTQLLQLREYWRDELASVFGIDRMNGRAGSGGSSISVY